jgi:DNA-binding transcriptional regulator YhcF (GntR family)/predicted GIY-YIG superfamily endonuclease
MDLPRQRTALYRLYDADDRLLYVGITSNPNERFGHHAATKAWWPEVARRDIEWRDTRPEAEAAEIEAIRAEAPLYNGQHAVSPIQIDATLKKRSDAPYMQMAAALRTAIRNGEYPAGTKLPPTKTLREMFGTSTATINRALDELKREGLIEGRTGAGIFVLDTERRSVNVPIHDATLAAQTLATHLPRADLVALTQALVSLLAEE